MALQSSFSLLEDLPQELLEDVLARVASSSVQNLNPCLFVSPQLSSAVQDDYVIKHLNLRRQAMNPLLTFHRFQKFMKNAIRSNHPVAHYVEGIKQYFVYDNTASGFGHLKKASKGAYDNATFLYGILNLCMGNIEEGRSVMRSLDWDTDKSRTTKAWREVKRSLRYGFVIMKPEYTATLRNKQPPESCHKNDKDNLCPSCFHYKMMRKFIGVVRTQI